MLSFDENRLRHILIHELGYSAPFAKLTIRRIKELDHRFQEPLDEWMASRRAPSDFHVEGVTFQMIVAKTGEDFIHSLFLMNMILKKPSLAKQFF